MQIYLFFHKNTTWFYTKKEINQQNSCNYIYTQEESDYIFKYLEFDKFDQNDNYICFNNKETEEWFYKTYLNNSYSKELKYISYIYDQFPEGYQWLKDNFGKNIFTFQFKSYKDKQALKKVVNKIINVDLIKGKT